MTRDEEMVRLAEWKTENELRIQDDPNKAQVIDQNRRIKQRINELRNQKQSPSIDDAISVVQEQRAEWERQLKLVNGIQEAQLRILTATHACHLILEALERLKQ